MARAATMESRRRKRLLSMDNNICGEICTTESVSLQRITLATLSPEVLGLIFRFLSAKTLLNLSETSRRLHSECLGNGALWKELCKYLILLPRQYAKENVDFQIHLLVKGPFDSFHDIYRLVYKSQIIFEERNHVTFTGMLPDWMFTWCIMCNGPPSLKFVLLPIGKAKRLWGLLDEELPRVEHNGTRRNIAWSECLEVALAKWGSDAGFQEHVLKRLMRTQKKVDSLYTQELQSRRKRYYRRLRMGEKYANLNDVLVVKDKNIYLNYFEPQLIGEHYIHGKLHRFGRKQLKEYMKFAIKTYELAKSSCEDFKESDIVECVLLTYKDMAKRVENDFVRWKEFLEYGQKFLSRQQKVWKWQTEKSIEHCIEYRSSEKVKTMPQYKEYIQTGHCNWLRLLKRHFEGLEKISRWANMNPWILEIIDTAVRRTLLNTDDIITDNNINSSSLPGLGPEAQELHRSISNFLVSGRDADFRMVLLTVSNIAKSKLKQSACLVKQLEFLIGCDSSTNLLVSVDSEMQSRSKRKLYPGTISCPKTTIAFAKSNFTTRKTATKRKSTITTTTTADVSPAAMAAASGRHCDDAGSSASSSTGTCACPCSSRAFRKRRRYERIVERMLSLNAAVQRAGGQQLCHHGQNHHDHVEDP
eukprot:gene16606-18292_t